MQREVQLVLANIKESKCPLFILGQGCLIAPGKYSKLTYPYVTTILAKPYLHGENYLGAIGILGDEQANQSLKKADLLICVGCRLSERSILNDSNVLNNKRIIYVNISSAICRYKNTFTYTIMCDGATFLEALISESILLGQEPINSHSLDLSYSNKTETALIKENGTFDVETATSIILSFSTTRDAICLDDGLYTLSFLKQHKKTKVLFWGSMAAGGSAMGGSIGTASTLLYNKTIVIIGDGGILSVLGEIQTIVKYKLPIMLIVFNNHGYRSIDNWAEGKYEQEFGEVIFSAVAATFKMKYTLCTNANELIRCLTAMDLELPCLIELEISQEYSTLQNHFRKHEQER